MSKKQKSQIFSKSVIDKIVSPWSAAILISSINIFFWQLVRTNQSESWDKIIYVTSLLLSLIFVLVRHKIFKQEMELQALL